MLFTCVNTKVSPTRDDSHPRDTRGTASLNWLRLVKCVCNSNADRVELLVDWLLDARRKRASRETMHTSSSSGAASRCVVREAVAGGGGGVRPTRVSSCPLEAAAAPTLSVLRSPDTEKPADLESGHEAHDEKPQTATCSCCQQRWHRRPAAAEDSYSFRFLLRRILLGGGGLWLVFMLVLDPPFALYWMLVNVLIVLVGCVYLHCHDSTVMNQHSSKRGRLETGGRSSMPTKRWVAGLASLALIGNLVVLSVLREFELRDLVDFEPPVIPGLTTVPLDRVHFFRIFNPKLSYTDDVEAIHQYVNGKESSRNQTAVQVQRYAVDKKLNAWSSDMLRFNFLLQFWRQTRDAEQKQSQRASAQPKNAIVCLVESDIVFDEAYFSNILREHQTQRETQDASLELAHIQHFWGHTKLEPFNIGILCTSSRASWRTRLWMRLMSALHSKRYRRLLYLDVLYAFVQERLVFSWDQHHGCTEYYPHCRYIHFTRPKGDGIERALEAIAQEKVSNRGS